MLATMHDSTHDKYMRVMEGGAMFDNWPAFYRSVYDPIWADTEKDPHLNKTLPQANLEDSREAGSLHRA